MKINNLGNNGNCCMGMEGNGNKNPVRQSSTEYAFLIPNCYLPVLNSALLIQACNRLMVHF